MYLSFPFAAVVVVIVVVVVVADSLAWQTLSQSLVTPYFSHWVSNGASTFDCDCDLSSSHWTHHRLRPQGPNKERVVRILFTRF